MNITDKNIDSGRAFDWGRTSENYARFRDVYPQEFYDKIVERNLCVKGCPLKMRLQQRVNDSP